MILHRPSCLPRGFDRVLLAGLLLAAVTCPAAPPSFRSVETLPSLSLRLPLMAGARTVPNPPLQTFRYTLTRGTESWQEERYLPHALWYAEQHAAEWVDAAGTRVILGIVNSILPTAFAEAHVTREHYAGIAASAAARIDQVDGALLRRWLQDFAGASLGEPQSLPVNRSRLADLWGFPAESPRLHAFIFRLDPRRAGQAHVPNVWFGLVVVTAGEEPVQEREAVLRELVGGIEATGRFENRTSTRFMPGGTGPQVRQHPSRDAAKRSIEHLADWWFQDSDDYVVLSNLHDARRFAEALLDDLQAARALYARFVPAFAPTSEDVSVVRIFATDREYDAYVGPDQAWSSGLFDASRRELILRPAQFRSRDARYSRTLQVALHEVFHQYLFQATGGRQTSAWFNEGHATFFEVAEIGARRNVIDENDNRVKTLEKLVAARDFSIRPMLTMDYATFYGGTDAQRQSNYSLAWGLVYYLQRGAPLERNRPHAAIPTRYMLGLARGLSPEAATAFAFDGISLDSFERSFVEFWKSSRLRGAARRAALP